MRGGNLNPRTLSLLGVGKALARCRFRLEVTSASTATGAVQRPLDECVDEALWKQVAAGDPVTLQLVSGALGAELVGVVAAGAAP